MVSACRLYAALAAVTCLDAMQRRQAFEQNKTAREIAPAGGW
jgi:hypothetical protein